MNLGILKQAKQLEIEILRLQKLITEYEYILRNLNSLELTLNVNMFTTSFSSKLEITQEEDKQNLVNLITKLKTDAEKDLTKVNDKFSAL